MDFPHIQSETIQRKQKKIAILRMDLLPPNGTLNKDLLAELLAALRHATIQHDAMILTSDHEKFFCNGLDGNVLLSQTPHERYQTIDAMIQAFIDFQTIEKPWIAAINGYAMAGGAVIASGADYRYMKQGNYKFGFSELLLGIPLPAVYILGIQLLYQSPLQKNIIYATAYKPEEAFRMGIVDGVCRDQDHLISMSLKQLDALFRLNSEAFSRTRKSFKKLLVNQLEQVRDLDREEIQHYVFSNEFEQSLEKIREKNS